MTSHLPEPIADSVDVAAYRLGICRAQLYKEVQAGRIKVRKLGRRTLVPRTEQQYWLDALPVHDPAAVVAAGDPHLSQMSEAEVRAVIEQLNGTRVAA
jgi:hypothetical protein